MVQPGQGLGSGARRLAEVDPVAAV